MMQKDFQYWKRRYELCCWAVNIVEAWAATEGVPAWSWWGKKKRAYWSKVCRYLGRYLSTCVREMTAQSRRSALYSKLECVYKHYHRGGRDL